MSADTRIDLKEFDRIYRLTRMAVDAEDDTPGKDRLIEVAEDEMYDLLKEADRLLPGLFGEGWMKRIGVISSAVASIGLDNTLSQLGVTEMDELTKEQDELFMAATRIASQVGFIVGFSLALKSAGTWEQLRKDVDGGKNDRA